MEKPPFIFGTQYFRPPFPNEFRWRDDIKAISDAGLNAIQLWLVWGWCELEPGKFVFEDYDRLFDLAEEHNLGVVLSTLPEVNPFWIPRVYPDALMVDIEGRRVENCNRWECLSGVVPGACSDHPHIRVLMTQFLEACGQHFRERSNLLAWDVWNENRWRNHAQDIVCFCEYSKRSLHDFLNKKYGGVAELGAAWGRRYVSWDDVRIGRLQGLSYPEMNDYTQWMCHRAQEMSAWRVETLKNVDPHHVVVTHTGSPTVFGGINLNENIFSRGIDWDVAVGDAYGYSSFPKTIVPMEPDEFCVRSSAVATAGRDKPMWMSELQGGQAVVAGMYGSPLTGAEQQAWIWAGIARGAKAVLLWGWRNEKFGIESNRFGVIGFDGLADDRQRMLRSSAEILAEHGELFRDFQPDSPQVGVLFQRNTYFRHWMDSNWKKLSGTTGNGYQAPTHWLAYPRALERLNVPYAIYDDRHLPSANCALKFMIVPDASGLDDTAAGWLCEFARQGGAVFVEGAAGCYGPDTYFRNPNERLFYQKLGLREEWHRGLACAVRNIPDSWVDGFDAIELHLSDYEATFAPEQPGVVALEPDGVSLLANVRYGSGKVLCLGSLVSEDTTKMPSSCWEDWLRNLLQWAGVPRTISVESDGKGLCSARLGNAGRQRVLIVTNLNGAQRVTLQLQNELAQFESLSKLYCSDGAMAMEVANGQLQIQLTTQEFDHAVLKWPKPGFPKAEY